MTRRIAHRRRPRENGLSTPRAVSGPRQRIGEQDALTSEQRLSRVLLASRREARLLERAEAVAHIGGFELDPETLRFYFTAEAYRLHDLDPAHFDPTLERVLQLYPSKARAELGQAVTAALDHGDAFDLELPLCSAHGRELWLRMTGRAELAAGRTVLVFGTLQDITERRAAELALRKSEQRFRGYFELSVVGLAITTPDKGMVEVNDHCCQQIGYGREELLSKNWAEFTHPDDRAADVALWKRVLAREIDSYTVDKRLIRKDGSLLYTEVSVRCVRRADGSVEYVLGLLHDVSQRVKAERALLESSELFAKSFQEVPDALTVSDLTSGQFLDVNQGFERLFGYSRAEIIGKTSTELGFVEDEERAGLIAELRHSGTLRNVRVNMRVRGGESRTTLLSANTVEIGSRTRLLVLVRDITEQEAADRALRESEERFVKAFQASPNAIAISELDTGRLLEVNDSYVRISGLSREALIGHSAEELGLWPEVDMRLFRRRLRETGTLRELEINARNARGEAIVALVSAEIVETKGRRCMIMTAQDVTERRRIEEAKARLESALRQAQKMEAIGTLAGGIAHDFNNILGAIIAFTELARMDAQGNAAVLGSLNEVCRAGERAKDLVRQILTFSRRQPQERRTIALQPLVKEILTLVRSTLPASVAISSAISEQACCVDADASQLHQVLLNLCTNAAQAMRGRAGDLRVELVPQALVGEPAAARGLAPGAYVRLSVYDSGCGMDADTQKRIFEPFFTTKQPGEGTGLGLSVVHGIVEDHRGVIWVESQLARGSAFHVLLPTIAGAQVASSEEPEELPQGNRERVLYIDDEAMLCRAAKRLLERLNYVVTAHTSARDALESFRTEPEAFDLVVTDLTMPSMTGVELATELLRIRPGVPIVLITGYSANLDTDTVEALGIRQLASKPLSAAALARTVKAALSG